MIEWHVRVDEFATCNCAYSCPCQFGIANLPTKGFCETVLSYQIHQGQFGDVRLDGLRAALLAQWPGPIPLGNGKMQLIIDERADARQREALVKIMTGEETEEMATIWWLFGVMCPTKLEPLYLPIELTVDVEARRARLNINGVVEASGEPIKIPVTGVEHRVRIDQPQGFHYRMAEVGSSTTRATGAIKLDLKDSYGQFAHTHFSNKGVLK